MGSQHLALLWAKDTQWNQTVRLKSDPSLERKEKKLN